MKKAKLTKPIKLPIEYTDKKEVFILGMGWTGNLTVCSLSKCVRVYLFNK